MTVREGEAVLKAFQHTLLNWQAQYRPSHYLLACSGGVDSMTLLQLLQLSRAQLSAPLEVIYINHGWHPDAAQWGDLVNAVCVQYNFPCTQISLALTAIESNKEAVARQARYAVFARKLAPRGVLLTAHHQNDQVETFFINLLRGSGLAGLSAMPARKAFAQGEQWRPLLGISREEISTYAQKMQLRYVDDPSNDDTHFERNWLRHDILPKVCARKPHALDAVARSASWLAEAADLQQELLAECIEIDEHNRLSLAHWETHSPALQAALVRYWLQMGHKPMPPFRQLEEWLAQIARGENHAQLDYGEWILLRYQNWLYCLPQQIAAPPAKMQEANDWQGVGKLIFSAGFETLPAAAKWALPEAGMRFLPRGKKHHKLLNEWLRIARIPPLMRKRIPLIVNENEVIWAGHLGASEKHKDIALIWKA